MCNIETRSGNRQSQPDKTVESNRTKFTRRESCPLAMCGIIGHIGLKEAKPVLINSLKRLEYRGYDSSGIALKNSEIKVYKDKVVLEIPNALWAGFTNTNSMDPFLDERSNAVEIKPSNPEAIKVGDVIAYDSPYGTLIHRVVEKGHDQQGIYYRVKGDNSTITDPMKVRFEQVEGVVVAVIY